MNRRRQNAVVRAWDDTKRLVKVLDPLVTPALLRGTHDSGLHRRGEPVPDDFQPPRGDPTGETAILEPIDDHTHQIVLKLAESITKAHGYAGVLMKLLEQAGVEPDEKPICQACQDEVTGRVLGAYDEKCYKRWKRAGSPDRGEFEAMVRRERMSIVSTAS